MQKVMRLLVFNSKLIKRCQKDINTVKNVGVLDLCTCQ